MTVLAVTLQVLIAVGIVNVWVFRYNKPTRFRPGNARNMVEEFREYRLPDWVRTATGVAKLALASLLIVGIWYAPVAAPAAVVMALLMVGAIGAHIRVGDPVIKSVPAFSMLVASVIVAYTYVT